MLRFSPFVLLTCLVAAQETAAPATAAYDPLQVLAKAPASLERTVADTAHRRELPVRVYLPAATTPAPVILLSHGLGGTRDTGGYLGEHWSGRGYAVVAIQHPGSDDRVWRGAGLGQRKAAMTRAASAENLRHRIDDVHAVLDELARWNADGQDACHARFDLEHVGMSGHSFGAITTQMVGGQSVPLFGQRALDPRIDAALAMSPSCPKVGDLDQAFGAVPMPWFLMTGTKDDSPIGDQDAASRRKVYPHLPQAIDRYELVLDGATHMAFGDRGQAVHHRSILALSTAFWDSYLRGDGAAREWLQGAGAKAVLGKDDAWAVDRAGA